MSEGIKRPIVIVAACALLNGEGAVLIAKRPAGRSLAGLWEFPGGKVEAGEEPEDALIREFREELGIEIAERSHAAHLREPRLSRLPPAHAGLSLPAVAGRRYRA